MPNDIDIQLKQHILSTPHKMYSVLYEIPKPAQFCVPCLCSYSVMFIISELSSV